MPGTRERESERLLSQSSIDQHLSGEKKTTGTMQVPFSLTGIRLCLLLAVATSVRKRPHSSSPPPPPPPPPPRQCHFSARSTGMTKKNSTECPQALTHFLVFHSLMMKVSFRTLVYGLGFQAQERSGGGGGGGRHDEAKIGQIK